MSDANRVQLACRKETTFSKADEAVVSVPVFVPSGTANGTMTKPTAPNTVLKETWTAKCKTAGGDGTGDFDITTSGITVPDPATILVGEKYEDATGISFIINQGTGAGTAFAVGDVFTFDVDAELQIMRHTGESLKQDTTVITSEEIRSDRQIADIIRTGVGASGGVDFELSYGTFDEFLQAVLFSAGWSTEVTLPSALSALIPDLTAPADGTMTKIYADNDAPVETWTITCTSVENVFTVIGTKSGAVVGFETVTVDEDYDNGFVAFRITAGASAFVEDDVFTFNVTRGKTISVLSDVDNNSFNELLTLIPIIEASIGTGTIAEISAPGATPPKSMKSETWTIRCKTGGAAAAAILSVTGSVSGDQADTDGIDYDNGYIKFTVGGTWVADDEFVITNNFGGLVATQWIRVAGFVAPYTANNGWFKIVSADSLQVVVSHGILATASVNIETITMQLGAQIANGTTFTSWNIEREYKDLTNIFSLFTGMSIGEMSLDVPADGRITGSFTFLGVKEVSGSASVGTGNTAATTTNIMTGANHVDDVFENKLEAGILSFAMSINNNLRTRLQVGTLGAVSIGSGSILITGSLELYLPDATLFDKYLKQTPSSLAIGVTDGSGNGYIIEIPTMRITDGSRPAGGLNTDVVGTFEWQAYMDPTESISIRITRFPVL